MMDGVSDETPWEPTGNPYAYNRSQAEESAEHMCRVFTVYSGRDDDSTETCIKVKIVMEHWRQWKTKHGLNVGAWANEMRAIMAERGESGKGS